MEELIKITTNDEGKQLVSARELYDFLKPTERFSKWFERYCKYEFEENIDYIGYEIYNKLARQKLQDYAITTIVAKDICRKQRRNKSALLMFKYLSEIDKKEVYIIEPQRKEIIFINKLKTTLSPFNIKGINQYTVLNYRIDYYIPDLNIAIEYDENEHKNYSYEAHEGRQKEIEKELGCRFIRVSDKNSDEYNIGLVIKEIFNI